MHVATLRRGLGVGQNDYARHRGGTQAVTVRGGECSHISLGGRRGGQAATWCCHETGFHFSPAPRTVSESAFRPRPQRDISPHTGEAS